MSLTLTIRLSKELTLWLETAAAKNGVSKSKLVREQLEKARASSGAQTFMRLAGIAHGRKDLSTRKGFHAR
jgi:predicted transcriptional regulator